MGRDVIYTNGIIAAREKYFLGGKLSRMCESTPEEAFRILSESGYGRGSAAESPADFEEMALAEERALDEFIREYAPSDAERDYLLSPRDFHNAKSLLKAAYLHADAEKMLAPEGLIPVRELSEAVSAGDFSRLGKELGAALEEGAAALEQGGASGAEIGGIFERAMFRHLAAAVSRNGVLKKLLAGRADRLNVLTAMRASGQAQAEKQYVEGGRLTKKQLDGLFGADPEKAAHSLDGTPYAAFVGKCFAAKSAGLPLTEAEREAASFETEFFAARKYDLERNQPFLYYVFRRRAENANVRIVFVCLQAGMREGEIKKRLRAM